MKIRKKALQCDSIEQYSIPENRKIQECCHTLEMKKQSYAKV